MVSNDDWAELVNELKRLRRQSGVSLQGLSKSPVLLRVLNDPPLQEAFDKLQAQVAALGDGQRVEALKQAFNFGRSRENVTGRRSDQDSDPKTLAGYENQMIDELASRLLGSRKPEVSESRVVVVGVLNGMHLRSVTVSVYFPPDESGDRFERSVEYENRAGHQSLPALIYQLPHDWQPKLLSLTVHLDEQAIEIAPTLFAAAGNQLLDLMFGNFGGPVAYSGVLASVHFQDPRPGALYLLYWTPDPAHS